MGRYCLILGLVLTLPALGALPEGYERIVLSRHATEDVAEAARHLADLLERCFGTAPAIRRANMAGGPGGIHIGPGRGHESFDDDPLTDEIVVERGPRGIEITGSDNTSTCFAVYRFAEAFLGWRYFQPGELGLERLDEPPLHPSVHGEDEILLHERAGFISRNPSIRGTVSSGPDWARWHGGRERFAYNHTLHRVLPPSQFDKHPDWFAKDPSGNPIRQPYAHPHGYNNHPDLSQTDVRDWVAWQTISSLRNPGKASATQPLVRRSPGLVSISISLGDSFVFGNFPDDYIYRPHRYFRRWPDWSNHVFAYSNAVARAVSEDWQGDHPGQRLLIGALSYLNWENTPDFNVHPSIVPFITFDRSQWYDRAAREDDLDLVSRWKTKGPEILGTWDYIFGYGFLIPRSLKSIISDSIPALHERGVRAYFSQVMPAWPYDALTTWLTYRLLWDPTADPEVLAKEFYREFYGPAADSMQAFLEKAEAVWMSQQGSGWWLRYWKDPWQAALWESSDLIAMETHLQAALAKTRLHKADQASGLLPERFEQRVQETADLFGITRMFIHYQSLGWKLQSGNWETASARELAKGAALARETMEARRSLSELAHAHDLSWIFRYDGTGASIAGILHRATRQKWLPDGLYKEATAVMTDWLTAHGLEGRPDFRVGSQVLADTDFNEVDDPAVWTRQQLGSEGLQMGRGGRHVGYTANSVRRGHISQLFPAKEGHYYLAMLDLESVQSPSGEVYIKLDFFKDGELLAESPRARLAPVEAFGSRQRIRALMQAPEGTAYGRLRIRFYEMDQGSVADLTQIEVLDLGQVPNP